jgi:PAS domain-containing protein
VKDPEREIIAGTTHVAVEKGEQDDHTGSRANRDRMENVATREGHVLAAEISEHRIRSQRSTGRQSDAGSVEAEVFDCFPYGILVVDRSGAVVAANSAAADIVGGLDGDDGHRRHSCELLGCRAQGPLAHVCLTEPR